MEILDSQRVAVAYQGRRRSQPVMPAAPVRTQFASLDYARASFFLSEVAEALAERRIVDAPEGSTNFHIVDRAS